MKRELESLKVMVLSLDRHLKNKDYSLSIFRYREFISSKQVLGGKVKQLRATVSLCGPPQASKQSSIPTRRGRKIL